MRIVIGQGSCGIAAGAEKVRQALLDENIGCEIGITGCIGMCYLEPIVDIYDNGNNLTRLVKVSPDDAKAIADFVSNGNTAAVEKLMVSDEDKAFLNKQTRIALRNCGIINPEDIDAYIGAEGYTALKKAVCDLTPEQVIEIIKTSGLAGRGGAGFPTWFKWNAARQSEGEEKYLICNADEGDPGAFMDRAVIESDPHNLIEGMLIGAYAIGAKHAVVYVRAEYPLAIKRLKKAIEQAEEKGIIGNNIFGSGFSCDFTIKAGAGAFVCGEETALNESLEGHRGMPRLKPPFPAQSGFWHKPSNINNVETFANVSWIINNGGEAFAAMGTEGSKGTKVFAVTGKVKRSGLVEIPMGKTLRDVIFDIGGGMKGDKPFKAVQMGGPSGGCIPADLIDTIIDYKALGATGAIMGSGGMVVMDESTCMVGMAKFFL
ncbi:MAG: SLBB domain-containing protein, partial [Clostridia bacterium]|nr:SLBB domain-containing protein [Clostridia bacterium]